MSVPRDVLILADIAGGTEIWNKRTRPRNTSPSSPFPLCALFSFLSLSELSICSASSPTLLWNLGCYRGNTGTGRRRLHRRPSDRREMEENAKIPSFSRPPSFASLSPSSAISSPSLVSSVSPIRCSKKSIRLSLPTRSVALSFCDTVLSVSPCCFLSRLRARHIASHVERRAAHNERDVARGE